jgi:hypothetical protein
MYRDTLATDKNKKECGIQEGKEIDQRVRAYATVEWDFPFLLK